MLDANVQDSVPLIQPLLDLFSDDGDVPYPQVTHALSAILRPVPFVALKSMGLYSVIQDGLRSPIPALQILALEQVQKMAEADDEIVHSLLDCLGAEDASVGGKAVDVITHVPTLFREVNNLIYLSYFLRTRFNRSFYDWQRRRILLFKSLGFLI